MTEELLIAYMNHKCTPSGLRQVEEWAHADSAHAEWLFEMESVWALKNELKYSDERETATEWHRCRSEIERRRKLAVHERKTVRISKQSAFLRYAAAAAAMVVILSGIYLYMNRSDVKTKMNMVETSSGERISLTLADGSRVWLNAKSRLEFPVAFSRDKREVYLTGEGYFEIAGDAKRPLIVHSEQLEITVSGTKFNVKAYSGETSTVTLTEGKVEVSTLRDKEHVSLAPGHQSVCSENDGLKVREVDAEEYLAWIKGELYFVRKPLSVIAGDLERRFGVHIRFADPQLSGNVFTCHFQDDVSLIQILDFLKKTQYFNYEVKGRDILIIK